MIKFIVLKAWKDPFKNQPIFKTSAKENIILCNGEISKVVTYSLLWKGLILALQTIWLNNYMNSVFSEKVFPFFNLKMNLILKI